jgi:hypothetical protein
MEKLSILFVHLEQITDIRYILWQLGIFSPFWHILLRKIWQSLQERKATEKIEKAFFGKLCWPLLQAHCILFINCILYICRGHLFVSKVSNTNASMYIKL